MVLGGGTMTHHDELISALKGEMGQPGDTFWLRGGDYVIGHIDTEIRGAPGQPIMFRQMPGEKARIDGSLTFWGRGGYVVLRDFELHSSDTNRLSAQMGMGFDPTDIQPISGVACYVPNMSFINLIVRDHSRHGLYIAENATNTLAYGCLVYNNGWASPDNAEGHNFYVQGDRGSRDIVDNVAFNAAGVNYHIYESHSGRCLTGITLDGNVAFHAGALQAVRAYRDWIVGVDLPGSSADKIVLKNNMGYSQPASAHYEQVEIGREGINGSVALLNNYLPQGLVMRNWTIAAVAGNLFAGQAGNYIVSLDETQVPLTAAWDDNRYLRQATGRDFARSSIDYGFADWQSATGFDENSTHSVGRLSGTKVFVRPNRYEAGRANIVVYNWDELSHVKVDVRSVLTAGAAYEVRNAQSFFDPPVLSAVFDGNPLVLPMAGLTVAAPNGPLLTPSPTGPTFNVFVLLPRLIRLRIELVRGQAQAFWPTNFGNWIPQFTDSLSPDGSWTDDTSTPVVIDGQYVLTNLGSQVPRFYRLRAAQ